MKHIMTLEKFNKPYSTLNVGDIYITDKVWISSSMLDDEDRKKLRRFDVSGTGHKRIFDMIKIINIDTDKINRSGMPPIKVKAFFKDDEKQYIFKLNKNDLIRKATPEEKEKFNLMDNTQKYNL